MLILSNAMEIQLFYKFLTDMVRSLKRFLQARSQGYLQGYLIGQISMAINISFSCWQNTGIKFSHSKLLERSSAIKQGAYIAYNNAHL